MERIKISPLKISGALELLKYAGDYQLKRRLQAWKFQKYGLKQTTVRYKKIAVEVLYTLAKDTDEVLTVTVRTKNGFVFGKDDQL